MTTRPAHATSLARLTKRERARMVQVDALLQVYVRARAQHHASYPADLVAAQAAAARGGRHAVPAPPWERATGRDRPGRWPAVQPSPAGRSTGPPLLVRPHAGRFQPIAGERRWRAAGMAGLECMPCPVRETCTAAGALLRLLENLQRWGMAPIDKAQAHAQMHYREFSQQADRRHGA